MVMSQGTVRQSLMTSNCQVIIIDHDLDVAYHHGDIAEGDGGGDSYIII